ncbi:peroxidase family protein [Bosea sp. (in: a-proteobacteria)]|uniref:peroxidase family protein n=1 Tax=Bosea sp. (in: a-proteobacteria) TaxID=1871050 RepID=UPI00273267FC|nr:peroxidase family protein [Bosea sp. (in: a-proteobacteria)]MDP3254400.1 peroxidase family protein [Bosea sp. (in: a-proteobacteria)]
MFKLNLHDLEFVLKQIKIGEANANGADLTEIRVDPTTGEIITDATAYAGGVFVGNATYPLTNVDGPILYVRAIPDPHTPFGIRTVDGTYNNLVEGQETWGAAGQGMPRLLDGGAYLNEVDGDSISFGPTSTLTNTNYTPGSPSSQGPGTVVDADPRLISNLVSDMSLNNPAAIVAALTFAGNEDPYGTLADVQAEQPDWAANLAVMLSPTAMLSPTPPPTAAAIAAAKEAARDAVNLVLEPFGIEVDTSGSLSIPNVAPDEGLSAPFNAWMTFFGQFFDHGLDLISKGGAGTIYIPLQPDDPLYVPGGRTNFMVLTRSTNIPTDDPNQPTQRNVTTSWVDQNQTYTSHASHQVFLREYATVAGRTVATGNLLDGVGPDGGKNGLPTWADVKNQAREMLGIQLEDRDVGSVPLILTDAYGNFIPDAATGYARVIVGVGGDGVPNTFDDITVSGTPASPIIPTAVGALRTNNAFLDDIAHNAVPTGTFDHDNDPLTANVAIAADTDTDTGNAIGTDMRGNRVAYDNELLDRHFITGDGRGNENIGLTAVHHVFHSEHNRQVELQKKTILESGNLAFINEWLSTPITNLNQIDTPVEIAGLNWDGERLFQAARMATEMQYQHLVFEEFGRKIQPAIDPFVFNAVTDIDPSIFAEFANVIYRFGHSMLTDSMPRVFIDQTTGAITSQDDMGLIASFLNPLVFNYVDADGNPATAPVQISAEQAAGAIVRGMTTERGNEIDEFLTGALRNNLLGIPLDLGAINIARGRDTNMPTLNEAREQLYAATSSTFLKPYESWVEFAANLKNPLSVVNFIAAYGTHPSIEGTVAEKRDAAMKLVFGDPDLVLVNEIAAFNADRIAFLNATGAYTAANTGLNSIDLWIGGLAEKKMPFGGFLGSTFNAVFEAQMEALQDGDRFYYLTRTQGLNFLVELEENSFAKMIMANTDLAQPGPDGIRGTADDIVTRHIGADSFAAYDYVFEVNAANQHDYDPDNLSLSGVDPGGNDPVLEALGFGKVVRDDPRTAAVETNYFRTFGGEHVVVGGTDGNDTIITDFGDDGIWGGAGNDRIESGAGVDLVLGGAGDDIITDSGDTGDFLKGEEGNDVIANSNGLDVIMGGEGKDVIFVGVDDTEVFGGEGNDFILGGDGMDFLMGNEGDDWIEAGGGFDTTAGDNSELFFNSTILGHDVMFAGSEEHDFDAESGDDIMVQGPSVMRSEGMLGFDWSIHKSNPEAADSDLTKPIFTTDAEDILRDRFDAVEALSGWERDDVLRGDDRSSTPADGAGNLANAEGTMVGHELTQAGVDRIDGLRLLMGSALAQGTSGFEGGIAFDDGNILLGGAGSDLIEGRGGNDFIDGDAWLNVRIRITAPGVSNTAANELATIDSLKHTFTAPQLLALGLTDPSLVGKTLSELMIDRQIVPTQLNIVREIVLDDGVGENGVRDIDVAVFNDSYLAADGTPNYTITQNGDGTFTVSHDNVTIGIDPDTGRQIVSDGVDTIRNVEVLQFADRAISLVKPVLELNGFDPVNRNWGDDFTTRAYTNNNPGTTNAFNGAWVESGDAGAAQSATDGSIQITTLGTLTFSQGNADDSSIARSLNLANAVSATVSFTISDVNITGADNEEIIFEVSGDGVTFTTLETFDNGDGAQSFILPASALTANAVLRFRSNNTLDGGQNPESFSIDNLAVNAVFLAPSATPSVDVTANYDEDAVAVSIGSDPRITDFGSTLASARIVLTNAFPGDTLVVPASLAALGISAVTQVVASTIVVTLTGTASLAAYQTAIQSIGFRNTSQAPDTTPRIIETTVNGGFFESDPAITTITVQSVDDPVNAGNDTIITNALPGTAIVVPKWALLANDTDPDNTIDITAVSTTIGSDLVANLGADAITVTDTGTPGGSFQYTAAGGPATDNATVTLNSVANTTTLSETFGSTSYTDNDGTGVNTWADNWGENGDDGSSTSDNGQIRINGSRLEFDNGNNAGNSNGASIQRGLSGLAGAPSATISYNVTEALDANETVTVQFSRDGTNANLQQVQLINSATGNNGVSNFVLTGPFTAAAFIRFTVSALNDGDDLVSIDDISVTFPTTVNGGATGEILIGDVNGSTFNAGGGNDIVIGGLGNDTIDAGTGNDTIVWNANATGPTDGRDFMNGGGNTDTVIINGNDGGDAFVVYSRAAAITNGVTPLNANTEIVITRNGVAIADLDNVEEIIINTGDGTDSVSTIGTFAGTTLLPNTITINGGADDDTVDISALASAHRVVFRSNGGNDTIVGDLRPQDVVELAAGQDISGYTLVNNGNGTQTFGNGTHSITFTGAVPPQFQNGPGTGGTGLDDEDLEDLLDMVQDGLVRDSSGYGNNVDNPEWGTSGGQFIRLTDAYYTDGASGIRQTGLTPRDISNILSNQDNDGDGIEESIVNAFGGTSLLTFFGQYFDHGLDFVAKGQPGSVYIGDVGATPVNAPRSNIVPGTGVDPDGIPNSGDEIPAEYVNQASPYVDQNQTYGSSNAITNLLRRWEVGADGEPVQTAYLLSGDIDASGNPLLPTLDHIRANYRVMTGGDELTAEDISNYDGSGQPLLIDFIPAFVPGTNPPQLDLDAIGHYFIAGDGRANENVMLTSIHTIWERNHNFWVDEIKTKTNNAWTEAEYFEAARMMNIAEYQRVVFTEFATAMAGGFDGDDEHGFEGYDPTVDASISVEFAQAAYRFGHSMLNETVSYVDANGDLQEISLVQAFLSPNQVSALGIDGLIGGSVQVQHQAIDEDVVNALRNQLVGRPLDLAALNIFRGRDMGIAPFNEVRSQLYEQTGLSALRPYSDWADFAQRNDISATMLGKLQLAYPDGFETMDLWIGGLLEKPMAGQLGSTFGYIFLEQLDRLQHGDRFYYLEIFDDSLFTDENSITFAKIIERNTGLTGLPENVFDLDASNAPADDDDSIFDNDDDDDDAGNGDDDDDDDDTDGDDDDQDDDDDDAGNGDDDDSDDDDDGDDCGCDDDDVATPPPASPSGGGLRTGTPGTDVLVGTAGADNIIGFAGDDVLIGEAGDDRVSAGEGADFVDAGAGADIVFLGGGDDHGFGGAGNDALYGEAGDDRVFGEAGDDRLEGGVGRDTMVGGAGDDLIVAAVGDGDDTYHGDDLDGGDGVDTLDMSAISASITVDLGSGLLGRGSAVSVESGTDTLWGIENVATGSGEDTITASAAVNVMEGGAGDDVFRFTSVQAADGDTILDFEPGDRLDLSGIDADTGADGNQAFTIASGPQFTASAQLLVTYETRADGDYTVVSGNVNGDDEADFQINLKGTHTLSPGNIVL